ncbi:MAG: hypothetical protein LQ346_007739 [Caloplaca aetnensis]|nr:MAG: hypothetical protein LQ346_007739 [Caloplaca aetnensis]
MTCTLFLSFFLSTLAIASPHPQRGGNRHRHDVVARAVPTSTGNGKRGLAYNDQSPSLDVFSNSEITWVHDWNSAPGNAPSSFMFVPTLWSDKSPHSDNWDQLAAGHPYLMSFNEPDIVGQADMTVGDALNAYKSLMFPKRTGSVQIGAPSVSSGSGTNEHGNPYGTGWLREFLRQCDDPNSCVADFVSGHWYGCPSGACTVQNDVDAFKFYVGDLVDAAAGRDVWIPEFQRFGDAEGQRQFLQAVLPELDANAAVKRYAYFMVADGILTTGGQVSELGRVFVAG